MCKKCGYREESFYHIFYQCLDLARHRIEVFSSAWLDPLYIRRGSVRMVLPLAL
jgi:hypothetical protein